MAVQRDPLDDMEQTQLFPAPNRKRTRRVWNPKASVSENISKVPTCWKDCAMCSSELRGQQHRNPKYRLYRLCTRPGRQVEERCFPHSAICDKCVQLPKAEVPKSAPRGWEDY